MMHKDKHKVATIKIATIYTNGTGYAFQSDFELVNTAQDKNKYHCAVLTCL